MNLEPTVTVHHMADGLESVVDAFRANFAEGLDVGAGFAAYVNGRLAVWMTGGYADTDTALAFDESTITLSFSGTKGLVAMCAALLVDRGALDLTRPVAEYWPEFAHGGKQATTVAELLSHRARLPVIETPLRLDDIRDGARMASLLASQTPRPELEQTGSHAYHALTFGWLAAELVRRVDGRTIGEFFREEIAAPAGADVWIGVPLDLHPRVSQLIPDPDWVRNAKLNGDEFRTNELLRLMLGNPPILTPGTFPWNRTSFRAAEMPASNGAGTAEGIARAYSAFAEQISTETLRVVTAPVTTGRDAILGAGMRFGIGFDLDAPVRDGWGHGGNGGSLHGYWPDHRTSFSYLPTLMSKAPRGERVLEALDLALITRDRI